jgi:hypothetical protein
MCAMALVHSRLGRVVFCRPNPAAGAVASRYRLHGERSLNHRCAVRLASGQRAPQFVAPPLGTLLAAVEDMWDDERQGTLHHLPPLMNSIFSGIRADQPSMHPVAGTRSTGCRSLKMQQVPHLRMGWRPQPVSMACRNNVCASRCVPVRIIIRTYASDAHTRS